MTQPSETAPSGSVQLGPALADVIGRLPYRVQLAGGWIDQPFMSALNPEPPGSMVVVSLQPTVRYMDRCGMATGTRNVARALWGEELPRRDQGELIRELYEAENNGSARPSGSQDMAGLIIPGISRLDYDVRVDGGWFPSHIETTSDAATAAWLESVLHLIPVAPRPPDYDPLWMKRLDPQWIGRLARSGRICYEAIVRHDLAALGGSLVECSLAWDALLPGIFTHPTLTMDLKELLAAYQSEYPGAMYSGCGGGYLVVASEREVPGSFAISVRTA
jgi:hypothetical protein